MGCPTAAAAVPPAGRAPRTAPAPAARRPPPGLPPRPGAAARPPAGSTSRWRGTRRRSRSRTATGCGRTTILVAIASSQLDPEEHDRLDVAGPSSASGSPKPGWPGCSTLTSTYSRTNSPSAEHEGQPGRLPLDDARVEGGVERHPEQQVDADEHDPARVAGDQRQDRGRGSPGRPGSRPGSGRGPRTVGHIRRAAPSRRTRRMALDRSSPASDSCMPQPRRGTAASGAARPARSRPRSGGPRT